ncbi:MAG: LptF/LptG family permease [Gemmatimonadota bacterium]|nr:LptF/LptG family permease [Gemmatimonadota bacterium]
MRLLDRYLIRQFLPPLVFAFVAMTSIMLLNQVARRFGALVGKGLPWSVIGEVFLLCLPFIIAMTLPMAVLTGVLYTFSHLAADSEITAMRASGISVSRLVRPMALTGVLITALNFWFTDQILPQSNARLRNLLINIQRKKPTLELREQVINEIPPSGLFLRSSRIDATSGRLRSVTIYDMSGSDARRVIYADSGVMGFTPSGEDLQLRLYDGSIHAFRQSDQALVQVTDFRANTILVREVSNRLDLDTDEGVRGDREMSTCEMMEVVRSAQYDIAGAAHRRTTGASRDLRALLDLGAAGPRPRPAADPPPAYCKAFGALARLVTADSGTPAQPAPPSPVEVPSPRLPGGSVAPERALERARRVFRGEAEGEVTDQPERRIVRLANWGEVSAARDEARTSTLRANQYLIEVHKKWAISIACLVFALVGIPMALRFPRGGLGLVIGGGLAVFAIYYVGLIAGEALGDKGIVPPGVIMWAPNLVFTVVALLGLYRVARESGSTRGGDLRELWESIAGRFRRRRAA